MASYEERRAQNARAHMERGLRARKECCFRAKMAEQSERFDDMILIVKNIIKITLQRKKGEEGAELSMEERNLLSVAYKNIVGKRRSAWRTLTTVRSKYEKHEKSPAAVLLSNYIRKIEGEILAYSVELQEQVDLLIPLVSSIEGRVFFRKMCADYERYLCEIFVGEELKRSAEKALMHYKLASMDAEKNLHPTNPIRLGVALNFAVFYFETLGSSDRACHLARTAFDDALAELDTLPEKHYKDSTILLQLIRDNLQKWAEKDDFGPVVRGTLGGPKRDDAVQS